MNQEAVQETHHHTEAFQKMFEELKEVFRDDVKPLRDVLKLESPSDSMQIVPTMHSEVTFVTNAEPEKFTRLMKADSFSETCAELTKEMLCHFQKESKNQFGLDSWLKMSLDVFRTIVRFPNLTSLSDIKQIRQTKEMKDWIERKMRSTFWSSEKAEKHEEVKRAVWNECCRAAVASDSDELAAKVKQLGLWKILYCNIFVLCCFFLGQEQWHRRECWNLLHWWWFAEKLKSSRLAFDEELGDLQQRLEQKMKEKKCDEKVRKDMTQFLDSLIERERSAWLHGATQDWQKWQVGWSLRKMLRLENGGAKGGDVGPDWSKSRCVKGVILLHSCRTS